MTRHAPALLALSIIAVAGWAYNVNYDTRAALDRLSGLRAEIAEEREALQVLRVEWAYLNAPDRLARLVAAHHDAIGLVPLLPEALGIAAAIPYPPRDERNQPPGAPEDTSPDPLLAAGAREPAAASAAVASATPASNPLLANAPTTGSPDAGVIAVALSAAPVEKSGAPATPARAPASALGPVNEGQGGETVPAALEVAIAAALAEAGVSAERAVRRDALDRVRVPAAIPAGVFAAAGGVPLPEARPASWSGR